MAAPYIHSLIQRNVPMTAIMIPAIMIIGMTAMILSIALSVADAWLTSYGAKITNT